MTCHFKLLLPCVAMETCGMKFHVFGIILAVISMLHYGMQKHIVTNTECYKGNYK